MYYYFEKKLNYENYESYVCISRLKQNFFYKKIIWKHLFMYLKLIHMIHSFILFIFKIITMKTMNHMFLSERKKSITMITMKNMNHMFVLVFYN